MSYDESYRSIFEMWFKSHWPNDDKEAAGAALRDFLQAMGPILAQQTEEVLRRQGISVRRMW